VGSVNSVVIEFVALSFGKLRAGGYRIMMKGRE
jgi:hypothetical protein